MKEPKFFNISNHPSSGWGEKQRKAAEDFGKIVDIPFPSVNPFLSGREINGKAERFFEENIWPYISWEHSKVCPSWNGWAIKEAVKGHIFHIMGEISFCYQLISFLMYYKGRCVVSTTDRNVVETKNEKGETIKKTVFSFVRFREII